MRQRPNGTKPTHQRHRPLSWLPRCIGWCVWLLLLVGCQCQDQPIAPGKLATDAKDGKLVFDGPITLTPQRQSIVIYNASSSDVTIADVGISNDPDGRFQLLSTPSFPHVLAPGKEAGLTLTIQLAPNHTKGAIARLVITSPDAANADSNDHFIVPIEHYIQTGVLTMDCGGSLDFGEVTPGKSRSQLCTIRNTGSAPIVLEHPTYKPVAGQGQEFSISDETRWPLTIQPDDASGVTLRFVYAPKSFDELHDKGTFTIAAQRETGPQQTPLTIAVEGTTKAALIEVQIELSNCESDEDCQHFGTRFSCKESSSGLPLCITSQPTKLTLFDWSRKDYIALYIRSPGNITLQLQDISTTHPKAIRIYGSRSTKIDPGEYGRWLVYYDGFPPDQSQADIIIKSDAANHPLYVIPIEVNPRPCRLYLKPERWWQRQIIALGQFFDDRNTQRISLINKGTGSCHIKKISIIPKTPEDKQAFALRNASAPHTLSQGGTAGDTLTFELDLTEQTETPLRQATLRIESDDPDRPVIAYPILGASKEFVPCLKLSRTNFDYPVGRNGVCTQPTQTFELRHTSAKGCGLITITGLRWESEQDRATSLPFKDIPLIPHQMAPGDSFTFTLSVSPKVTRLSDSLVMTTDFTAQPKIKLNVNIEFDSPADKVAEYQQRKSLPTPFPQGYLRYITFEGIVQITKVSMDMDSGYRELQEKGNWRYEPSTRTLHFEDNAIPPPGANLRIAYKLYCVDRRSP